MMQAEQFDDCVVVTGEVLGVRGGLELAAQYSEGIDGRVEIGPKYFRATEIDLLLGDATKARESSGWRPEQLMERMVEADLELAARVKCAQG